MRIYKAAGALIICLLLMSSGSRQPPGIIIPEVLSKQLKEHRQQNDITSWIYDQLDWVNELPATRAMLLKEARENCWRQPGNTEENQAWLILLMNEGHAMLLSGNIVGSTDAYRLALKWVKEHSNITSDGQILEYILKPLGNNYTRLGDYEQALFIQKKALETAASMDNKEAAAGVFSNLAVTSVSMGAFERSLFYCTEGLKIIQGNTAVKGLLLAERSEAYMKLNRMDSARKSIRESLQILTGATSGDANSYWLFMALQQAGDIYADRPAEAESYYTKAAHLRQQLSGQGEILHPRESAKLFYRLGLLYKTTSRYDLAIGWFNKCIEQLIPGRTFLTVQAEDLYGENTLVDVLFARAELLAAQQQPDPALRLYGLCFSTEKKLRLEYITGSSKERSVADSRSRYEAAIEAAYHAWQSTGKSVYREHLLNFIESGKAQLLLEELMQQQYASAGKTKDSLGNRISLLEKALVFHQKNLTAGKLSGHVNAEDEIQQKQIEWELADLRKSSNNNNSISINSMPDQVFNYKELSRALKPGQIARSFFTGTKAIYTVEISCKGISFLDKQLVIPAFADTIGLFIQQYFRNGPDAMLNHPKSYYHQAYAIYNTLFGRHPLKSSGQYILLPDGILNALPVDALVNQPVYSPSPQEWPFIIKEASICYAYSLQTLQQQLKPATGGKGFTGLFIAENNQQDAFLQSVFKEKEGIAQFVKSGHWLLNKQATSAAFYDALESSDVLHISSHASAGAESPVAPHIRLYDSPFYLFELKALSHHPALAILSACQTGDGKQLSGEGVQSLARAFIANGTNAVIAGWWNVNDAATALVMTGFYASLSENKAAAAALREAKLSWLNNPSTSYMEKLPYYWASLNYQGAPDPLSNNNWMRRASSGRLVYWVSGLIIFGLLLCSLLFWQRRRRSFSRQD